MRLYFFSFLKLKFKDYQRVKSSFDSRGYKGLSILKKSENIFFVDCEKIEN